MTNSFSSPIRQMQEGTVPTGREFICPLCGGTAQVRVGTLSALFADCLWMEAWCEDCGEVENSEGIPPWPGYELLLATETRYYSQEDNIQRMRRFAQKGQRFPAARLYQELYGVGLQTAYEEIMKMVTREKPPVNLQLSFDAQN